MAVRPRPIVDGLIAATAFGFGKIVVTRNVADFAGAGAQIINPWAL
jgi:toxin FitB